MNSPRFLDRLFFTPMSDTGFGLMRMAWGTIAFFSILLLWPDRQTFFSAEGVLPLELADGILRWDWRFSLLDFLQAPGAINAYFLLLLLSSAMMALGILPRLSTLLSVLLLWSLHERNPFVFAGGDTVLRLTGFILIIAPSLNAFSLSRLRERISHARHGKKYAMPAMVPSYAYRLLLWQIIVLYSMSLGEKMLGNMWRWGTAVETVLHHPAFTRAPLWFLNWLTPLSPFVTWSVLVFHALWILLLVPKELTALLPSRIPRIRLKRLLIILGICFHGSIFLLLDAGNFSLVMFTAYLGLLADDDFSMMRTLWNWRWSGQISVLYDGHCGFCRRSLAVLTVCDWGKRLLPVDYQDRDLREAHGKGISFEALDRSLHIVLPNGTVLAGFDAFRELCEHLPPLIPLLAILWLPGVDTLGRRIYAKIAEDRKRCSHENCQRS